MYNPSNSHRRDVAPFPVDRRGRRRPCGLVRSRLTARPWCAATTGCPILTGCIRRAGTAPCSCTPSTCSRSRATICGRSRLSGARRGWRRCSPRRPPASGSTSTPPISTAHRVRGRLQDGPRRHRVEATRFPLPFRPVQGPDQGQEPGKPGNAARRRRVVNATVAAAPVCLLATMPRGSGAAAAPGAGLRAHGQCEKPRDRHGPDLRRQAPVAIAILCHRLREHRTRGRQWPMGGWDPALRYGPRTSLPKCSAGSAAGPYGCASHCPGKLGESVRIQAWAPALALVNLGPRWVPDLMFQ